MLRRRPDVKTGRRSTIEVPDDEQAQFELDQLAVVRAIADRLRSHMTALVFAARRRGAS